MVRVARRLVSKKKRRWEAEGFSLDLCYITDHLIAMGYPAAMPMSLYRNPRNQVKRFLDQRHGSKYFVWNLCLEMTYDKALFDQRMHDTYRFRDHEAPPFDIMLPLCKEIDNWIQANTDNVAVLHCKAGKGRTGVAICAYLLYSGAYDDAQAALDFYAVNRTFNQKGVTIPSQRRYVGYVWEAMQNNERPPYPGKQLTVHRIRLSPVPPTGTRMIMQVRGHDSTIHDTGVIEGRRSLVDGEECAEIEIKGGLDLSGDVRFGFKSKNGRKTHNMFHFWFNTFFVSGNNVHLTKPELDKAYKKREYPDNFTVTLMCSAPDSNNHDDNSNDNNGVGQ